MTMHAVSYLLNHDLKEVLQNPIDIEDLKAMIDLEKIVAFNHLLDSLYREVFGCLTFALELTEFPTGFSDECVHTELLYLFISCVLNFVKSKFRDSIERPDKIRVYREKRMRASVLEESTMFADLAIAIDLGPEVYYLLVVKVNQMCPELAFPLCAAYDQQSFEDNKDGERVYGLCATAKQISLACYDENDGHKVSEEFPLMNRKSRFLNYENFVMDCSAIIDIVFACLCKKLKLI